VRTAALSKTGRVLVDHVDVTTRMFERMCGLLGRDGLAPGQAMYIAPCNGIHTIGMRFDLDLIFVGRDLEIVRIVRRVSPGRIVSGGRAARGVIELQAGWFPEDALAVGDRVELA